MIKQGSENTNVNSEQKPSGLIKTFNSEAKKESPYRKVAKFLLLIGVDEAAKVISRLSPEQTERVVLELASVRSISKEEASIVFAEFEYLLQKAREPSGGVETARSILEAAFGSERANEMLDKVVPFHKGKPFEYLEEIDPQRLLRLMHDELPQVKALVLSQLKPQLAARVIALMDTESKKDTVLRLAKLKEINPDVLRRVDGAMREKVQSIQTSNADAIDGRSALAEILKRMDSSSEQSILEGLEKENPELSGDLRERLFTIDDITRADDKYLQTLLREFSEKEIALLLVQKTDTFREKILSNISKTRGLIVLEEEVLVRPASKRDVQAITDKFFSIIRRAWENGECYIKGRDEQDIWVN